MCKIEIFKNLILVCQASRERDFYCHCQHIYHSYPSSALFIYVKPVFGDNCDILISILLLFILFCVDLQLQHSTRYT